MTALTNTASCDFTGHNLHLSKYATYGGWVSSRSDPYEYSINRHPITCSTTLRRACSRPTIRRYGSTRFHDTCSSIRNEHSLQRPIKSRFIRKPGFIGRHVRPSKWGSSTSSLIIETAKPQRRIPQQQFPTPTGWIGLRG